MHTTSNWKHVVRCSELPTLYLFVFWGFDQIQQRQYICLYLLLKEMHLFILLQHLRHENTTIVYFICPHYNSAFSNKTTLVRFSNVFFLCFTKLSTSLTHKLSHCTWMNVSVGKGYFWLGTITTALPVATAAPSVVTVERRVFLSGRMTPITPRASGMERAEPDCGTGWRRRYSR